MKDAHDAPNGVTAKIKFMIIVRLEQALPHKEVVRKTAQYLLNPRYLQLSQKLLYQTIDLIWRTTGDDSKDIVLYETGMLSIVILHYTLFSCR